VKKLFIVFLLMASNAYAENILMARSQQNFTNTIIAAKQKIEEYGYTVSHIQKCDGGMHGVGYKTDGYKVLFFGKLDEVKKISKLHPEMIPFIPLKMAIIAEGNETLISIINPLELERLIGHNKMHTQFQRWESDFRSILAELRALEKE